jgi:hypothetical protein
MGDSISRENEQAGCQQKVMNASSSAAFKLDRAID